MHLTGIGSEEDPLFVAMIFKNLVKSIQEAELFGNAKKSIPSSYLQLKLLFSWFV